MYPQAQGYSGVYYTTALPPAPPVAAYGYPQYPPQFYYPVAAPPSPGGRNHVHRWEAQSRRPIDLNPFVDYGNRGTTDFIVWDASFGPKAAQRRFDRGRANAILTPNYLDQSVTSPPVPMMIIFCKDFEGVLRIKGKGERGVTLEQLLTGIHLGLFDEIEEDEWRFKSSDDRIMIHEARCERLMVGPVQFEPNPRVRRIDTLFGKTIFNGLKRVGPPEAPEWELKLTLPKPDKGKGKGKEKGKEKGKGWWP